MGVAVHKGRSAGRGAEGEELEWGEVREGEGGEQGQEEEEGEGEGRGEGEGGGISSDDAAALDAALSLAWLEDDFDDLIELLTAELGEGGLALGGLNPCDYMESSTGATALMVAAGTDVVLTPHGSQSDVALIGFRRSSDAAMTGI